MADKKRLLDIRKKIKSIKPTYLRSSIKIKSRLSKNWRKPKGLQNKMRLNKKGYPKAMRVGYGSPTEVKHLDQKSGLYPVVISNKKELEKINIKTQAILMSSTLGVKKKLEIIKIAEEKKIVLLQDVAKIKANIQKMLDAKKKAKAKVVERKKTKEKKEKKVSDKKKAKEEKEKESSKAENESKVHDNKDTQKAREADKANKEILQKRV